MVCSNGHLCLSSSVSLTNGYSFKASLNLTLTKAKSWQAAWHSSSSKRLYRQLYVHLCVSVRVQAGLQGHQLGTVSITWVSLRSHSLLFTISPASMLTNYNQLLAGQATFFFQVTFFYPYFWVAFLYLWIASQARSNSLVGGIRPRDSPPLS